MVINMKNKIIEELIKLLTKAAKHNEVPVAALIVFNDKIISKEYNKRENMNDVTGHAEIRCIKKAARKLKTWKLDNCIMYVTLKPCSMCEQVIRESRIKEIIYIIDKLDVKNEYNKTKISKLNDEESENKIKNIMSLFFKQKR